MTMSWGHTANRPSPRPAPAVLLARQVLGTGPTRASASVGGHSSPACDPLRKRTAAVPHNERGLNAIAHQEADAEQRWTLHTQRHFQTGSSSADGGTGTANRPDIPRVLALAGRTGDHRAGTEARCSCDQTTPIAVGWSRRAVGAVLLASCAAGVGVPGLALPGSGRAWARLPSPLPLPPCTGPLDGPLAAALTRAVYSTVQRLEVMDLEEFQRENFKLREREYRYYFEANQSQLPHVPDLADNTGGLSNPAYFNFINYCLWKVVYRHVSMPEEREAFARAAAADFVARMWPAGGLLLPTAGLAPSGPLAAAAAASAPSGRGAEGVVRSVVLPFLEVLRAGGYICRYQVVLGGHPGVWPQDWMLSQPVVMRTAPEGAEEGDSGGSNGTPSGGGAPDKVVAEAAPGSGTGGAVDAEGRSGQGSAWAEAAGMVAPAAPLEAEEFLFQVKLHRPADILGNVALRSEEGSAWPRTVSLSLTMLLLARLQEGAGSGADPSNLAAGAAAEDELQLQYQDRVAEEQRAQGQGHFGMAPTGEADPELVVRSPTPSAQAATQAEAWVECDEFFYQDQWQGPKSLADRLLLFFGDPLEQVGVDFVPTTLVQNWRVRVPGGRRGSTL